MRSGAEGLGLTHPCLDTSDALDLCFEPVIFSLHINVLFALL